MCAPRSYYRRIQQVQARLECLPPRIVLEAGYPHERLHRLPDAERREVLRLLNAAFDHRGLLDAKRLTDAERRYLHPRLLAIGID